MSMHKTNDSLLFEKPRVYSFRKLVYTHNENLFMSNKAE